MRTILLLLIILSFSASGQSAESLIKSGVDLIEINSDSAIVQFNKAIKLNPDDYEPWYYLAYCYSTVGNFKETIRYANEALKRKTDDPNSLALLGTVQILSVDKVIGCDNLNKSLLIDSTNENTRQVFSILCDKYYKVNIYNELKDSTIIDKINNHFNVNWTLNAIGEENGYLFFTLINNNYLNYRDGKTFGVEWRIYIFERRINENLIQVKDDYKLITSQVDYVTYHIMDKDVIIATIDSYLRNEDRDDYLVQRKRLINEVKKFVRTL